MADSAADRKSIRAKQKQALIEATIRADVIRTTMSTPSGRYWMWTILSDCHIFSQTYTGEPLSSAFNEGKRSIGLAIMADILRTCPDQYITAQRESHERDTLIEQRSSPIIHGGNPGPNDNDSAGSEASGTSDPESERDDPIDHSIIGVDAEVSANGYSRPYRNLNH